MSTHRFYCCPITQPTVELAGPEAVHIIRVMRLKRNDSVELFDGKGTLAQTTILDMSSDKVTVEVDKLETSPQRGGPGIIIAAGVAKGDRFDWLISKCTELAVDRICPVIYQRTVKQASNPKIVQRYNRLAISAAKQCGSLFVPIIDQPMGLEQLLGELKNDYPGVKIVTGSLAEKAQPLIKELPSATDVAAFVGPEGGFTEQEQELLERCGAIEVSLAATTLRVETAAVAFASILGAYREIPSQNGGG